MTHFQSVAFRIHTLARSGRTEEAVTEGAEALESARESGALMAIPAIELALTVAQFMHQDLDAADARARGLLDMPHLHTLALAHETLARIALMRDEIDEAHARADSLETLAERFGSLRQRALADCIRGRAALQVGERRRARELLHAALATYADLGLPHEIADVLDELAIGTLALREAETDATGQRRPASPTVESIERAARLSGAANAARAQLGCVPGPDIRGRLAEALRRIDACEQSTRWQAAWKQGEALTTAEAIAYARRGRGARDRPQSGQESLTPTEREVAKLAASGLSNPQIAKRLFISRGTVKMHLASTYRKLAIANRTELAAAVAQHSSDHASSALTPT
jgi:DNA-binding CsgD family transcriptional regulator